MQDEQNGLVHALIPFRYEGAPLRTTNALIEKIPEFSASAGVAKFSERLRLNLPDTLARNAEFLSDLFERIGTAVFKAETKMKDLAFAFGKVIEHFLDLLAQQMACRGFFRTWEIPVFDEVPELAVFFLADGGLEGNGELCDSANFLDLPGLDVHFL